MPNRILRDWTDSYAINSLTPIEERFFVRLMMKADDYGLFTADAKLLRAGLFPLLVDNVRISDVTRWIAACEKAGLIRMYTVNNKPYLEIKNFGQRLDKARPKHPLPPPDVRKSVESGNEFQRIESNRIDCPAEAEAETETETETNTHISAKIENLKKKDVGVLKIQDEKIDFSPPYEQVEMYFRKSGGDSEMSQLFFNKYSATGWTMNGSRIKNFAPLADNFIKNFKENHAKKEKNATTNATDRNPIIAGVADKIRAKYAL